MSLRTEAAPGLQLLKMQLLDLTDPAKKLDLISGGDSKLRDAMEVSERMRGAKRERRRRMKRNVCK